jgi:hypothetical protein
MMRFPSSRRARTPGPAAREASPGATEQDGSECETRHVDDALDEGVQDDDSRAERDGVCPLVAVANRREHANSETEVRQGDDEQTERETSRGEPWRLVSAEDRPERVLYPLAVVHEASLSHNPA